MAYLSRVTPLNTTSSTAPFNNSLSPLAKSIASDLNFNPSDVCLNTSRLTMAEE